MHFTGSHDNSRHTHPQVIIFVFHPIETDCLLHTGLMTVVFFLGEDCNYSPDRQGGSPVWCLQGICQPLHCKYPSANQNINMSMCVFKYCSLQRHRLESDLRVSGWFSFVTLCVLSATLCTVVCLAVCVILLFCWVHLAPPFFLLSVWPAHLLLKQLLLFLSFHTLSLQ